MLRPLFVLPQARLQLLRHRDRFQQKRSLTRISTRMSASDRCRIAGSCICFHRSLATISKETVTDLYYRSYCHQHSRFLLRLAAQNLHADGTIPPYDPAVSMPVHHSVHPANTRPTPGQHPNRKRKQSNINCKWSVFTWGVFTRFQILPLKACCGSNDPCREGRGSTLGIAHLHRCIIPWHKCCDAGMDQPLL